MLIGTFREWLRDSENNYKTFLSSLTELENLQNESLDSHSEIEKIESENGFKFYYFNIEDKKFRVILEVVDNETGINFEQFLNGKYTASGISKNLSAKEVMLLFGTLFYIIKKYSITLHYSVFTDDRKKFRVYMRILMGKGAKNIRYNFIYNGKVVHIEFETSDTESWITKKIKDFKYKTNFK